MYLVDESGTTVQAEALIGYSGGGRSDKKSNKDSVAAALILSAFFNDPRQAVLMRPPGMNMGQTRGGSRGGRGSGGNSSNSLQKGGVE